MRSLALLILLASQVSAEVVNGKFVDRVAVVESRTDHAAIGDGTRARGAWQMWADAWNQINSDRRKVGLFQYDWATYAHDPVVARQYATAYLIWTERSLARRLGRQPTAAEVYAAWNLGVGGFAKRGFSLARVPSATRNAIARLSR